MTLIRNAFWFVLQAVSGTVVVALLIPQSGVYGQEHQGHGEESMVLDTVVVTAERISDYVESNPNQVVVMGGEEILQRNMLSVDEALSAMAGVDVKRSSGVGSRISIRGSGKSSGVLVLLNGRPLNSSQYGAVDLSAIPVDMVESITVFKPPVPVWLGPGASEGAISIVTRDMTGTGKDKKKHATRIRAAGGSYGLVEGTVSHRTHLTSGSVMISASGKHMDGKRDNSDRDSGSVSLHWDNKTAGGHRVEFDGRYYTSEHGSPGPLDNPTPNARQSYQKASIDSRISGIAGDAGDYCLNLYGDTIDLEDKSQSGFTSTLDDVKLGLKGEYNWFDDENRWAVRANGMAERDDLEHSLSGSHQRVTTGLGVQADRNWSALTVTLGARGDHVTDFDVNPGFSSGVKYAVTPQWALSVNAGYTVKIPTFGQLYQPSHGSIDQVRGNPDLDKEKIYSADAALEFRKDTSHHFQISLFRTETLDTIVYRRGSDLVSQPVNSGRSWRHGLEATWKYAFQAGLTVDANAILQDSEVEDTGNKLTYTPPVTFKLSLQYTLKVTGTRLETALRYSGEQFSEMENREAEKLDDYITVDVKAVQPFKIKAVAAEWFLTVENVFDADYEVHFGYPDDGVRFVSGVNLTF